jgi:UDP-glucose 4-epimerase
MYYRNNVSGLVSLLQAMATTTACRSVVFSSTATVYGDPASVPIDESFPCAPESPYAHSKLMCENILASLRASDPPGAPACCVTSTRWARTPAA